MSTSMIRLSLTTVALVLQGASASISSVGSSLAAAAAAREASLEKAWSQDLEGGEEPKERVNPVKRVVKLLEDMRSTLAAEADKESEMYDKMVCWCQTNEKEKTQAVADAEAKDLRLSAEIEERAAKFGDLTATIDKTKKEIAGNTAALEEATAIREKEAAAFRDENKDLIQTVKNLKNAIAVLSKHQKTQAFLQLDDKSLVAPLRVLLKDCTAKYEMLTAARLERSDSFGSAPASSLLETRSAARKAGSQQQVLAVAASSVQSGTEKVQALVEALNSPGAALVQLPLDLAAQAIAQAAAKATAAKTFLQVSASNAQPLYESRSSQRSATIYGIMAQMLEEFEAEMSTAQKDELNSQEAYKELQAMKSEEISAGKEKLDTMQLQDADNSKALSDAKEDLSNTRKQRSADVEFLQNLKSTCNDLDKQWEQRTETRGAELKAVSEAITILTEDDNREMLAKSVSLLQVSSGMTMAMRQEAARSLRQAATAPEFEADDLLAAWHGRNGNHNRVLGPAGPRARLSTLAVAVQLDSFGKVKEMIDTMVAELKKQQEEEVAFKAYCDKELKETEATTYDKNVQKKDLESKVEQLQALMEQLAEEVKEARAQIADTQVGVKKAGETREEENVEFQSIVADQRATQNILNKALAKLKDFYEKKIGSKVFMQQTPPVQFNDYKANTGSTAVISLLDQVIADSKTLEAETVATESKAQADYESFVKDSNSLIEDLQEAIATKTKASAAAAADHTQAGVDLDSTNSELESLAQYDGDLHAECDFVLKNFETRQTARLQEIQAIQAAKAMLSGSSQSQ